MFYRKLAAKDFICWLVAVVLSGVGIASVLMLGPYLQATAVVLIGGESSEIYDGLRKYGVEGIAAYWAYVLELHKSPILICGLATAVGMAVAKNRSTFLIYASVAVAVGWTAMDINDLSEGGEIGASLICNIVGGVALALYGYVVHVKFEKLSAYFGLGSKWVSFCLWAVWPFIAYVALSYSIFFVLSYIIKIPTEPVSVTFDMPVRGYYWVSDDCDEEATGCGKSRSRGHKFGVMENISGRATSMLNIQGVGNPISLNWKKHSPNDVRIEFRVAQGCQGVKELAGLIAAPPFKVVSLPSLDIGLEGGFHHFRHLSPSATEKVLVSEPKDPVTFYISPSKDSSRIDVDRMIRGSQVKIEESMLRHDYSLGVLMVGFKDRRVEKEDRLVSFTSADDEVFSINFRLNEEGLRPDEEMKCRMVSVGDSGGSSELQVTEPLVNIIISVVRPSLTNFLGVSNDEWDLSGVDGWVSVHDLNVSDKGGFIDEGSLKQVSFSGLVKELQVGDFSVSDKVADVRISGDLVGQLRGGAITFTGDSRFVDIDGHRKSPTRWEALDVGFKIPILLGVPTAIWFVFQLLIGALRQNVGRVWRPFDSYRSAWS